MGLYEVLIFMSLLGLCMSILFANFHVYGMMLRNVMRILVSYVSHVPGV